MDLMAGQIILDHVVIVVIHTIVHHSTDYLSPSAGCGLVHCGMPNVLTSWGVS